MTPGNQRNPVRARAWVITIAAQMIERAIAAGVPFDWVATDTV
jgi:SRSO17 transposase